MQRKMIPFTLAAASLALCASVHAAPGGDGPAQRARPGHAPASAQQMLALCASSDPNQDGQISLEEFHQNISAGWFQLQPDEDGYVHLSQIKQIPGVDASTLRRLARADKDRDGRLSFREVVEARMAHFDAADTNGNDELSVQECVAGEQHRRSSR